MLSPAFKRAEAKNGQKANPEEYPNEELHGRQRLGFDKPPTTAILIL
jgi:hypothetical protein